MRSLDKNEQPCSGSGALHSHWRVDALISTSSAPEPPPSYSLEYVEGRFAPGDSIGARQRWKSWSARVQETLLMKIFCRVRIGQGMNNFHIYWTAEFINNVLLQKSVFSECFLCTALKSFYIQKCSPPHGTQMCRKNFRSVKSFLVLARSDPILTCCVRVASFLPQLITK